MENELIHIDLPDIVQVLQKINRREIRPDQVDWVKYLSDVVALRRVLNKSATDIQMLWIFAAEIDDYRARADIFELWQNAAQSCFPEKNERDEFYANCGCLYRLAMKLLGEVRHNDFHISQVYIGEGTKALNEVAYIWSDKCAKGADLVALAQEIYERVPLSCDKVPELALILMSHRCHDNHFHNSYDFCRLLWCAEYMRQRLITGKLNAEPVLYTSKIRRKLLKECFDEYISIRLEEIEMEMEVDYEDVRDLNEKDYLKHLYEEESMRANREFMFEDFKGSQAYCDQWYESRPEVLQLMQLFMEYLKSEKEKKDKVADKQVIVNNGDYVTGDKITGDVIKHVEAGGIGKQVIYGKQESTSSIDETKHQKANPVKEDKEELFRFIHPHVTSDADRMQVHKEIMNLVRNFPLPEIARYMQQMRKENRVYLSVKPELMFDELHRLGMPDENTPGFTYKNFTNYFNVK